MKLKQISAALLVAGLFGATSASAVVVGGVDFGTGGTHIDTTTLAETLITGNGQTLTGYGVVNTVNSNPFYAAGTDRLYFAFTYTSQNFSATSVEFTGGVLDIYYGAFRNLLAFSSAANMTYITGQTEWVRLLGHGNLGGLATPSAEILATGTLSGAAQSFGGTGLLDVDTTNAFGIAAVRSFLDSNGLFDALANPVDMRLNTSGDNSVLNVNDPKNAECKAGTAVAGDWCIQGSADLRGDLNVPEPASIALVGLALLGAGVAGSRKRKMG